MNLTLAPIPYFWPRTMVREFYEAVATWPVDVVYLGEIICSKRREMRTRDWQEVAGLLVAQGKEVVFSTLSLIEAESEILAMNRWVEHGGLLIEANDWSAVHSLHAHGLPFVAGASLNLYNHEALHFLQQRGMRRFVLGVDQGAEQLQALRTHFPAGAQHFPQTEVLVWGRVPLAYSARCFTARAQERSKDDCAHCCLQYPEGIVLDTREDQPFVCLNGIQVLSAQCCDLGPELEQLQALDVQYLRITPQAVGTGAVIERFRQGLAAAQPLGREGDCNGFWHGGPGMAWMSSANPSI